MYKIGEFSKIIGITTKTLRYYDAEGILSPSYRSSENGYRFYSEADMKKAEMIIEMRKFNFTISEMKDALRNIQNKDDFTDYLIEKVTITQELIVRYSQLISEIQEYLKEHIPMDKEEMNMNYQVVETEIPKMKFASIRFQGQYHEIGVYFELLYKNVQNKMIGAPFTCYHSLEYSEKTDIELYQSLYRRRRPQSAYPRYGRQDVSADYRQGLETVHRCRGKTCFKRGVEPCPQIPLYRNQRGKGHADEVWKERQDPRPLHAGTGKSPYAARRGYSVGNACHFRRALWYAAF